MLWRRAAAAAALVACTLATTETPTRVVADVPPIDPLPSTAGGNDPWLEQINWWRSFGGSVGGAEFDDAFTTAGGGDNEGPTNHVQYLTSIWAQDSEYCGHDEDPAFPKDPAVNYDHNVLFCGPGTLTESVNGWMNTPYHAPPLLAPQARRVGAGISEFDGQFASAAVSLGTFPVFDVYTWPKDDGVLPRTHMMSGEVPDPTAICPPLSGQAPGQSVFAWFPTDRQFVSLTVNDGSGAVPACVLRSDAFAATPLAAGDVEQQFTVFAQRPYAVGSEVTVSLITRADDGTDEQTLTWSFIATHLPADWLGSAQGVTEAIDVTLTAPTTAQSGGLPILERQLWLTPSAAPAFSWPVRRDLPLTGTSTVAVAPGTYGACIASRNAVGWSECNTAQGIVVHPNLPPTMPSLSAMSVPEGTDFEPIGQVSASDPNAGDTVTLVLGGQDAAAFGIFGGELFPLVDLDFETKSQYSITITARDQRGATSPAAAFTISVTNVNEAPSPPTLSNATVGISAPPGTVIGILSSTDPDIGDSIAKYTFGDSEQENFFIQGNLLRTAKTMPNEAGGYELAIDAHDQNGAVSDRSIFRIEVVEGGPSGGGGGSGFNALSPLRIFDTRQTDPQGAVPVVKQKYGGENVLRVKVTGVAGVPESGVGAVSLNVTAVDPEAAGFVTVFPCGERPLAANLNYVRGQIVPNAVIAPVSAAGEVCFFSLAPTHLIADVNGWFAAGAGFNALSPLRIFDTRPTDPNGAVPISKQKYGGSGNILRVKVTGAAGVPESGVGAVSLNVTAVDPDGAGFVTVFPCGTRPLAANLNYVRGQIVPNAVIAPVSAAGEVCFFSLATTHLIADVNGWFATGAAFGALSPLRIFDTRPTDPDGAVEVDKQKYGGTRNILRVKVTGAAGVPAAGVGAVSLNVTAVDPDAAGFITVYPCGVRPLAANLNYVRGDIVPNAVIAPVSENGEVCFFSLAPTHLIADVNGWFTI